MGGVDKQKNGVRLQLMGKAYVQARKCLAVEAIVSWNLEGERGGERIMDILGVL